MIRMLFQTSAYIQLSFIFLNQSIHLVFRFFHWHYLDSYKGLWYYFRNVISIMLDPYLIFQLFDNLYPVILVIRPSNFNFIFAAIAFPPKTLLLQMKFILLFHSPQPFLLIQVTQFHFLNFILHCFFKKLWNFTH